MRPRALPASACPPATLRPPAWQADVLRSLPGFCLGRSLECAETALPPGSFWPPGRRQRQGCSTWLWKPAGPSKAFGLLDPCPRSRPSVWSPLLQEAKAFLHLRPRRGRPVELFHGVGWSQHINFRCTPAGPTFSAWLRAGPLAGTGGPRLTQPPTRAQQGRGAPLHPAFSRDGNCVSRKYGTVP